LPVGENAPKFFAFAAPANGTSRSSNGMPSSRMSTHGRSDQDE
jgi:hypothetical protein